MTCRVDTDGMCASRAAAPPTTSACLGVCERCRRVRPGVSSLPNAALKSYRAVCISCTVAPSSRSLGTTRLSTPSPNARRTARSRRAADLPTWRRRPVRPAWPPAPPDPERVNDLRHCRAGAGSGASPITSCRAVQVFSTHLGINISPRPVFGPPRHTRRPVRGCRSCPECGCQRRHIAEWHQPAGDTVDGDLPCATGVGGDDGRPDAPASIRAVRGFVNRRRHHPSTVRSRSGTSSRRPSSSIDCPNPVRRLAFRCRRGSGRRR